MSNTTFRRYSCTQCTEGSVAMSSSSPDTLRFYETGYRGVKGPLCWDCRDRMYTMTQAEIDRMKTAQQVAAVLTS